MMDTSYYVIKFFNEDDECVSETIPLISHTKEMVLETKYKFRFHRYDIQTVSSWELEKIEMKNSRKKKCMQILDNKVSDRFLN